ncbi:MAG: phosphoribosylformylglycinamidine synthase, phosphoribosylformylglycinamidine synthase [Candidatus Peregrinibacteria bacterium GW2011_GWF2_43_17]|nr:MAG: phosphoribosylformylglycinamidine synthase, phosphoribosylformylglycinamidine synthase [Candidatus Peregrinibacteria bacterium GW2011_GWF2_43_17]HAU40100.1 phosphoribosylformylglycinamidine synthase [Candidatus Peregrinibacteria bacterium]
MPHRIEVGSRVPDTRAGVRKRKFQEFPFGKKIRDVFLVDVYTIDKKFRAKDLKKIGSALSNPVTEKFSVDAPIKMPAFDFAIEIGFLPGVTDNIGHTAKEIAQDLLKVEFKEGETVYTSQVSFVKGKITEMQAWELGEGLANPLIQRIYVKSFLEYKKNNGMGTIVPKVKLVHTPSVSEVNLNVSEDELVKIGKAGIANKDGSRRGPLALDLESMKVIKKYFEGLGRNPTDVEMESLAQTWSEHCKHTIFANSMDEIGEGIYKYYIKRATAEIRKKKGKKDFCVSVFKDNSGGIIFDDDWIITDKAETHNSPSALDPFGGAITGIVGVNRDAMGFGKGSKPVINLYGYCFADPADKSPLYKGENKSQKMLSPKRILEGVVAGVNSGGNCSGIPTPQGWVYFDKRYKGKPLIFVGTVGLIPRKVCGKPSWEKSAKPGDVIVMVGGRVGKDGIHGATFSSEAMDSGSPSTAVQIGDPITQKKMSDAIVKEARDLGLYNSITDNGAGGLSCSVAEMARECGGCLVDLDKIPLKYPGLDPWEIWISESQERMTLSVPKKSLKKFIDLMDRRGVEAVAIGEFNDSGKCTVVYNGAKVMDIDLGFLHDGVPKKHLSTKYLKIKYDEPNVDCPKDLTKTLHDMMSRLNVCSFDFISYQYDYVVQGSAVIGPLQGKGKVNGKASVMAPVLSSHKGVVISQGLYPRYSDIDTYHMAAAAIDTAIRNAVSVGVNFDKLALMDNFCWCSSDDERRLGQLKQAAKACFDYSTKFGTPFISGKDSMFNDFKGYDEDGNKVKISVPPTLLISSFGVTDDYRKSITLDVKFPGDLVYLIGDTYDETGGSEYFNYLGHIGNKVPHVDADKAIKTYKTFLSAVRGGLIVGSESVSIGGLGVSLARMSIAGQLGLDVDLSGISSEMRPDFLMFGESQSRLLVTVNPKNKSAFEKAMEGVTIHLIGRVRKDDKFDIKGLVKTNIETLNKFYRSTFKNY